MRWYALYTKPHREETVAERLRQAGIEAYSPKLKIKKFLRGVYREGVVQPFFPCYVFARFDSEDHLRMITYTRGVKRVVGGPDGPWPVAEELIELIRSQENNGFIKIATPGLKAGGRVKIAHGPFAGLLGVFERPLKAMERVVVLLNTLAYQARVVVERSSLVSIT